MTAKPSDLGRIQEVFDVVTQTQRQLVELGFSRERFWPCGRSSDSGAQKSGAVDRHGPAFVRKRATVRLPATPSLSCPRAWA